MPPCQMPLGFSHPPHNHLQPQSDLVLLLRPATATPALRFLHSVPHLLPLVLLRPSAPLLGLSHLQSLSSWCSAVLLYVPVLLHFRVFLFFYCFCLSLSRWYRPSDACHLTDETCAASACPHPPLQGHSLRPSRPHRSSESVLHRLYSLIPPQDLTICRPMILQCPFDVCVASSGHVLNHLPIVFVFIHHPVHCVLFALLSRWTFVILPCSSFFGLAVCFLSFWLFLSLCFPPLRSLLTI